MHQIEKQLVNTIAKIADKYTRLAYTHAATLAAERLARNPEFLAIAAHLEGVDLSTAHVDLDFTEANLVYGKFGVMGLHQYLLHKTQMDAAQVNVFIQEVFLPERESRADTNML